MCFYDASAAAKAYLREPESFDVRRWMTQAPVMVSRLTVVEIASAVHRRVRDGLLPPRARDVVLDALLAEAAEWIFVELTAEITTRAARLMGRHVLTTGDAIQLASALAARDAGGDAFGRFIAYDARLLAAARAEGLPIEDY